ncbi:hypothetical protein KJ966_23515 [bacterium]|nr:hypothetical protein [bacterium]
MKKWIGVVLIFTLVATPSLVDAIELMYIDTRGYRNFSCGSAGRGARIAIKELSGERFQILSKPYSGIMHLPSAIAKEKWCAGMMGAVRIICGLCEAPDSRGRIEDRKKQLGLHDAE